MVKFNLIEEYGSVFEIPRDLWVEGLCWNKVFIYTRNDWFCQEEVEAYYRKQKLPIPPELAYWEWADDEDYDPSGEIPEDEPTPTAPAEPEPEPEPVAPPKKKRGRPRKAELAPKKKE